MQEPSAHVAKEPRPSFLKGLLFLIVIAISLAGLAAFVLSQRSSEGPLVINEAPTPLGVDVIEARLQASLDLDEKFSGLVSAKRTSQLGFQSGGRIAALRADIGDRVEQGQSLAVLDTRALRSQLASAEAQVDEAIAAHSLAVSTVERQQALLEKGHVSQQRVDEAAAQATTAQARINAARAQAEALRVQIDLSQISAPFAGVITERMFDEGAIAAPGAPVFELVETGALEARIGLPSALAAELEPGETYTLTVDRGPVEAELRSVTGVINAGQRTVASVFEILDPEAVSVGAVVRMNMTRQVNEPGLWVPVTALSEGQRGLWSIYIARKDDDTWTVRPGLVEVIQSEGDQAFVRGAVSDGDLIIIDGLQRITPGQEVRPRLDQTANAADEG
ncbi:efflux RND transporter periplasmic adaptor subunit [Henriciella mobilis]|uniref:Efflux RND transporter periplasmic adaptor subunit n=1 Tax=Henriciella mobilis TaxID=2305467 RepID=A0A399R978_9PROT|nr:efflux RND transporter periplasmic adaptor subunit [Henriciella mobilis]RIJ14950.1 efflux RND transporter periplasmic adaptor subunit [Henriciella mobilis]RIJ21905.1 efflux RND transporter periplasmic adaptor subunit [Henriciella mobilis]RIJ26595.1 efflux RND transporter periplasmic adaptor subunit [Henriciella mobilis]